MSRYDSNPFADQEEVNPFADSRGPRPLPPERYDRGATIDIPLDNPKSAKEKEKEIKQREAELRRKEQELKRREAALGKDGLSNEKNFPACYPIIHHDIAKDIPIHLQRVMYVAFTTFLGFIVCLLWSITAVSVYWVSGGAWALPNWVMSLVHFLVFPPLAYFAWYRPLYYAMRTDSALSFAIFFFFYTSHIVFCVYDAVAPPTYWGGYSVAGLIPAIELLALNGLITAVVFYFLGFGLFVIEILMCLWVLKQVYTYFRGSGKAQDMGRDAVRAAI